MKTKYFIASVFAGLVLFGMSSCEKWTEPEVKESMTLTSSIKSAEYYHNLREYKKSDHRVSFGWFGNWTGVGTSLQASMAGLPDSVDFVSIWGPWYSPTPEMLEDFHTTRDVKGTRALMCDLVFDIGGKLNRFIPDLPKIEGNETEAEKAELKKQIGERIYEYWGWSEEQTEEGLQKRKEATAKYANAICDMMDEYDYDGFDIDAEPSYAQPFATKKELWKDGGQLMEVFITTIGKRCGPMAETEKGRQRLFVIDGEPNAIADTLGKYFNYYILQAYYDGFYPSSGRLGGMINHFKNCESIEQICKKTILTCNFESYASTGGSTEGQILGYALYEMNYNGNYYQAGGVGSFHMEYEYKAQVPDEVKAPGYFIPIDMRNVKGATYPWLRKAIQIMNPQI